MNDFLSKKITGVYDTPATYIVAVETERIICDSSLSGRTDSFTEESDWSIGW